MTAAAAQPPPLPPDVATLATGRQLGPYLSCYEPKKLGVVRLIGLLVFGLGLLVLAVVVLAFGPWFVALLLAGASAIFLVQIFRAPNINPSLAHRRLYVFQHGFIQATGAGPVDYRWDQIISVLQSVTRRYVNGVYVGTTYLYTVTRSDQKVTKLTQFYDRVGTFGETLAREVTAVQMPVAIAKLRAGETLYFGELAVNLGGVASAGKGSVPWSEIQAVQINKGYVSLRKHGKWLAWSGKPASEIPNLFVFLTLAERLAGNDHPAGAR